MTGNRRGGPGPPRRERSCDMDLSIFATVGFTVAAAVGILLILATSGRKKS